MLGLRDCAAGKHLFHTVQHQLLHQSRYHSIHFLQNEKSMIKERREIYIKLQEERNMPEKFTKFPRVYVVALGNGVFYEIKGIAGIPISYPRMPICLSSPIQCIQAESHKCSAANAVKLE